MFCVQCTLFKPLSSSFHQISRRTRHYVCRTFQEPNQAARYTCRDLLYHELHHILCKKENDGTSKLHFNRCLSSLKKVELPIFRMPKFELFLRLQQLPTWTHL